MVSGDLNFRFLPPVMVLRAAHAACVCVCVCVKERERACVCVRACVSEREREREREREGEYLYTCTCICVYTTRMYTIARKHTRAHTTQPFAKRCYASAAPAQSAPVMHSQNSEPQQMSSVRHDNADFSECVDPHPTHAASLQDGRAICRVLVRQAVGV